jgi:hypothetical protein
MAAEDLDLEECWKDIRPPRAQSLTATWHPPLKQDIEQWVLGLPTSSPLLAIKGPTPMHRMEVYRWICSVAGEETCRDVEDWLPAPRDHLVRCISSLKAGGPWNLLWELLDVQDFVVEEPLRGLVDQGFLFTEFYQALWETRFLLRESNPDVESLANALIHWMTEPELSPKDRQLLGRLRLSRPLQSDEERLDTLFFLLALARQNGAIGPAVVVFDGLERAVRQGQQARRQTLADLLKLVSAAERWGRLGKALGLVMGFESGVLSSLRRYNPKLSKKVSDGLIQPE